MVSSMKKLLGREGALWSLWSHSRRQQEAGPKAGRATSKNSQTSCQTFLEFDVCHVGHRNHVLLEDVEYFLDKTKAKECFDMLDLDRDGKISLQVCPLFMLFFFLLT